jgi:Flp pilus assembly protein TadG
MRSGMTLVYILVIWSVLVGFVSLAIDLGRVQEAKSKLFTAADAAARYAVTGLSDGSAASKAISVAAANSADGSPVVLQASDVEVGTWDSSSKTFTPTNISPNSVRVTARRTSARGNAISTTYASLLGQQSIDLSVVSVATVVNGTSTQNNVAGRCNPWLAGMPSGTTANWYDDAPNCAPSLFQGATFTAGAILNFQFTGSVSYFPGTQPFNPDGDTAWIINDYYAAANGGSEHGIANLYAPITSVIGVFLDDTQPDSSPAPASLDFTTAASRDFASLSPLLKQPFYIGDGLRADGVTPQQFVIPPGATRLFLGVMDGQQWSDNSGTLSTTVTKPTVISVVK